MMRSVRVVPAILTDSPTSLGRMVSGANSFATYVQIDIMDGLFVPSSSIGAHDLQAAGIRFEWEAHLMVQQPQVDLEAFRKISARRVDILGPTPPLIARVKNRHREQLLIKGMLTQAEKDSVLAAFGDVTARRKRASSVDLRCDVDPESFF